MIKRTYVDTWEEPTSFEEFIEEIEYSDVAQRPCVVCGTVGTWQGDRAICAKRFDNLKDAIYACVNPCDEVVISQRASNILVDGYHNVRPTFSSTGTTTMERIISRFTY